MKVRNVLSVSLKNLFRHKARAMLTITSMMIGAFLIAIMLSVGTGLKRFMLSQVTLFVNEQTITVQKAVDMQAEFGMNFGQGVQKYDDSQNSVDSATMGGASEETTSGMSDLIAQSMLGIEDLQKVTAVDHVKEAAFETFVTPDYIRLSSDEETRFKVNLYGMSPEYLKMLNFSVKQDDLLERPDALILSDGYAEVWGETNEELLGETVIIRMTRAVDHLAPGAPMMETQDFEMTIAGFFEKNIMSQIGFVTPTMSSRVNSYVQHMTIDEFEDQEQAFEIVVIVDRAENVLEVDNALEELGYDSMTTDETIGQIGIVFDVISVALSSFGVIAMFVASFGIVNTLLMAIYERTREIGVMKAVGATRLNISLLFTAEAAWLGVFGGALGLAVSWCVGTLVNWVLHHGIAFGSLTILEPVLKEYPTFDISVISVGTIVLVMGLTTGVAVFAGLYPSLRAGRLNPIDALRHD